MDTGQISLAEVLERLSGRGKVAFRMAIHSNDDPGILHTLVFDALPPSRVHEAPSFAYDYGDLWFIAGTLPASDVVEWIAAGAGALHPFGDTLIWRFAIPELTVSTSWQRYSSFHFDGHTAIPWPHTKQIFTFKQYPYGAQHMGMLIADRSPFFPTFQAALLSLVYGMKDWQRAAGPAPEPRVDIRLADTAGYLEHVTISPTEVKVQIGGESLSGSQIVVSGPPALEQMQSAGTSGEYTFPLPNEVPTPLWVVLARDKNWLDYYHRDPRLGFFRSGEQPNVTLDFGDLSTELEALIYQGEGVTTEFKEHVPAPARQMLKTVAAFANGDGGVILLGVKDRTGELVDIKEDLAGLKDRVTNMIRTDVTPEPEFRFAEGNVEHRKILAIYILAGATPPYGIDPRPEKTTYFVRRGATTFPARSEEIRAMVLARETATKRQSPYIS